MAQVQEFLTAPFLGLNVFVWILLGIMISIFIYKQSLSEPDEKGSEKEEPEAKKKKTDKPKKKFKFKSWMIYVLVALVVLSAASAAYFHFGRPEVAAGILGAAALAGLTVYYMRGWKKSARTKSSSPMATWKKATIAFGTILAIYKLLSWVDQPVKQSLESLLSLSKVSSESVSYTVILDARRPKWTKFDVDIPDSSVATFTAFGEVVCDPEVGPTGPEGAPWIPRQLKKSALPAQFLVDNIRVFSLVGRVGAMTFSIGRWLRQEFIEGGLLQLTLNERWQSKSFRDNYGSLTVLITIERLRRHLVVPALQFQEEAEYYWDVNHNYEPDSTDLSFLLNALQDPSVFPDGVYWYGDVNGDEAFNLVDIVYFQRFMIGQGPPPVKAIWLEPAR